jgi:hypothetical protein
LSAIARDPLHTAADMRAPFTAGKTMQRPADKQQIDEFFASASQVFAYYSWFVEISPRLIESKRRKHELIHFHIVENAIAMGFLINLRRLDEFFHAKKKYPDDVRAYEFGFATPGGFLSGPQRRKIDKQIAHPTEVPTDPKEKIHFTYILAHQALGCVFPFIDFILAGPHPPSTPYGRSIAFTKGQYLAYWADYTDLVPAKERLPIQD